MHYRSMAPHRSTKGYPGYTRVQQNSGQEENEETHGSIIYKDDDKFSNIPYPDQDEISIEKSHQKTHT